MIIKENPVKYDLNSKMDSVYNKYMVFSEEFREFRDMFDEFIETEDVNTSDAWYTRIAILSDYLNEVNNEIYKIQEEANNEFDEYEFSEEEFDEE